MYLLHVTELSIVSRLVEYNVNELLIMTHITWEAEVQHLFHRYLGFLYMDLRSQIIFGRKVIQISKYVHSRHRLSVFNTLIIRYACPSHFLEVCRSMEDVSEHC